MSVQIGLNREVSIPQRKQILIRRQSSQLQHLTCLLDSKALFDEAIPRMRSHQVEVFQTSNQCFQRDLEEVGEVQEVCWGYSFSPRLPNLVETALHTA